MNQRIAQTALFLIATLLSAVQPGRADNISWTNTSGGNWSIVANWSPNAIPGQADNVFITNSGTYLVTLDTTLVINSLTLGGASGQQSLTNANYNLTLVANSVINSNGILDFFGETLTSTNSLTVEGTINWQSATWNPIGGVTLTPSAFLNIQNSLELEGPLTNQGTVNWQGGYVRLWNNTNNYTAVVWNQSNAVWSIQNDQYFWAYYGGEQFHNAGTLFKMAGLGTTYFYPYLDNTGVVQTEFGSIQFYGNSNLRGSFVAGANTSFYFEGNYTNGPATSLTGAGKFYLYGNSATLTLQTNPIPNLSLVGGTVYLDSTFQQGGITNLTLIGSTLDATNVLLGNLVLSNDSAFNGSLTILSGGVLNGYGASLSGDVEIGDGGIFNWGGGTLDTNTELVVGSGGTLNINYDIYLLSALTNQGTVNWQEGNIYVYEDGATRTGAIWNQVSAIWNIINGGYTISAQDGPEQFHNTGLVIQNVAVTSYLDLFFDNEGMVEANSGTLYFEDGSNLGGIFQANANSTIEFGGVEYTNSTALNFEGMGTIELVGGTFLLLTNPVPNLQLVGGTVLLAPTFQGGTITNLTLNGATLGGTNTVTGTLVLSNNSAISGMLTVLASGVCTASGANFNGPVMVNSNGVLNTYGCQINSALPPVPLLISPGGIWNIGSTFSSFGPITNQGVANLLGGYVQLYFNTNDYYFGEIWNQPGAVWNIQDDSTAFNNWSATEQFNNAGVLRKNASFGTSSINVFLLNAGTVEAQTGTIELDSGSDLGGTFTADTNATIQFGGGNFAAGPGIDLSGAGTFQVNGGTFTLFTNVIPNLPLNGGTLVLDPSFQGGTITNLTLSGVTLSGTNTVTGTLTLTNSCNISGMLTVLGGGAYTDYGGAFSGPVTVNSNGVLNTSGSQLGSAVPLLIAPGGLWNIESSLSAFGPITNEGTVNLQSGYVQLYYNTNDNYFGEIWNLPGAVWNIQDDSTAFNYWQGYEQFNNAGALRKNNSFGTSYLYVILQNTGTVEAQTGNIQMEFGGNLGGNFIADANAVISLDTSSSFTNDLNPSLNFSGAGTFESVGGTVMLFTNIIPGFQYTGGTVLLDPSFQGGLITNLALQGAMLGGSNLIVAGNLSLNSGSITGLVTVLAEASLDATNASLGDTVVSPGGVLNWAGGTLSPGSYMSIASGATMNVFDDFIDLQGTLTNQGTVNWESANNIRLYNYSGIAQSADVWNLPGGLWNAQCDATIYNIYNTEEFHNAGTFRKSISLGQTYIEVIFDNIGALDAQSGNINFLTVETNTLETSGSLNCGINGLDDYGTITLYGNSPLNGAIGANFNNGFLPAAGESFTLVSYGSGETGTFTALNLPPNASWQTNYTFPSPGDFTITASQVLDLNSISTQYARASTLFNVNVSAADSEVPPDSLTYSLATFPAGMTINPATGLISWTPPNAASTNTVVVNATDNGSPALTNSLRFSVIVVPTHNNATPSLPGKSTNYVNELTQITITNTATDSDPYGTLSYSLLNAPVGAAISPNGIVTWTPAQTQSPSTNIFTVAVTNYDPYAAVQLAGAANQLTVIVTEVNVAPQLPVILTQTVNETTPVSVTNAATESNIHATSLAYGLVGAPAHMAINPATGVISWTPQQTQSPGAYLITTVVTDTDPYDTAHPHLTATNQFTIVVVEINDTPTLGAIAQQAVNELALLTVPNPATETNIHSSLSYALVNPPAGMSISPAGVITWTPAQTNSPSTNLVTTVVTASDPYDIVNPNLYATNSFNAVVREVNVAPVLPPSFTNTVNETNLFTVTNAAADSNIHAILSYSLLGASNNMAINAVTGVFTWTPTQFQSPGTNVITEVATATDSFDTAHSVLNTTNTFTVIVKEVNVAPVLPVIPAQIVKEYATLTVTNAATDSNIHATNFAYGFSSAPATMTINPTNGVITWSPTQLQGTSNYTVTTIVTNTDPYDLVNPHLTATNSFIVTAIEGNIAPTMPVIPSTNVNELTLLTITNTATDLDVHATIGYALVNPPAGAAINSNGIFTWTPAQTQSPSTNLITVAGISADPSDVIDPAVVSFNSFTVYVTEVNVAPVLPAIPTQTVDVSALLTVTNAATDSNIHGSNFTYGFLVAPPSGMSINGASGVITWTPVAGPSTNLITTVVTNTDSYDLVKPHLTATNTFAVIVYAPSLAAIGNQTVNAGQTVGFTASAADNDPSRTLTFSLVGAPATATIGAASGVFSWRPGVAEANTTNTIQVEVSANSTPPAMVTQTFKVIVNPLSQVSLNMQSYATGQPHLQITGPIGPDYYLQASSLLSIGSWTSLLTNTPVSSPFTLTDTNTGTNSKRFYRIQLGP